MKNYLFSTSRQWNPGDEFILHGILRIFRQIDPRFNPLIFNRNPEIKHQEGTEINFQLDLRKGRVKRLKPGFYDNSLKRELIGSPFVDLVVFAGTPEWASARMKVLYDFIRAFSIPVIYLGIGIGTENFKFEEIDETFCSVIQRALLITVRDQAAEKVLAKLNAVYLPCPALFSAPPTFEKNIRKIERIGLIYMSVTRVKSNTLDENAHRFMVGFYKEIMSKYKERFEFEFVCHYVDELVSFKNDFPGERCHYSYDSADYAGIYQQFDFVVGPRVHGIGIAASMGIPGISLQHDVRAGTCEGFMADRLALTASLEEAVLIFESGLDKFFSAGGSERLLLEKRKVFDRYLGKLNPILNKL